MMVSNFSSGVMDFKTESRRKEEEDEEERKEKKQKRTLPPKRPFSVSSDLDPVPRTLGSTERDL